MPIYIRSTVREGVGFTWIRPPFDPYLITSTGAEISTDNSSLVGNDSNHLVTIYGRAEGALSGIVLGDDVNQDSNETIRIGATGYVLGEVDGIHIDASDSDVRNEGIVVGRETGVELNANVGASRLFNSGTILSDSEGIRSTGGQTLIIENSGTIYGPKHAIATFGGATAIITNTGEIVGEIYLDAGNDVYNGVNGRVSGPIICFGGNDTVNAGIDDDTIRGMIGDDILNGGLGADQMEGGTGNDTFFVDTAADTVIEISGEGTADRVKASASYVLKSGVYVEVLTTTLDTGTTAINLTGNALKQDITGNAGANELSDGGAGAADVMRGLGGNDTYRVFNTGDTIVEGATAGTDDKVVAAVSYALGTGVYVEMMQTSSGAGTSAINLYGNEFAQSMIAGNNGANKLEGKGGADTLRGLGGADTFVFGTKLGGGNTDTIVDFNPTDDRFLLSDAIFKALTPGTITADQFQANTTGRAEDATDRIIYNTDSGGIFYDADGLGGAAGVRFAIVSTGLAITNADFDVV